MKSIGVSPNKYLYKIILIIIALIYFFEIRNYFKNSDIIQLIFSTLILGLYLYYILIVNHIQYDDKSILLRNVIKSISKEKKDFEYIFSFAGPLDLYKIKFINDEKLYLVALTLGHFTISNDKELTIKDITNELNPSK